MLEPEENFATRRALKVGMLTDGGLPAAWMALAAGWSGGSIVPPEYGFSAAGPHQTARAVRAGIMIEMTQTLSDQVSAVLKPCVDSAHRNSPCAMVPDVR